MKADSWIAARTVRLAPVFTAVILAAIAIRNFDLYFQRYASAPQMHDAFYYRQYAIAQKLLNSTSPMKRYVLFDRGKPKVWGLPTDAHTIAYLTSTLTPQEQARKNIHYGYIGDVASSDSTEVISIPVDSLN